jgi:hypothetical protein
MDYGETMSTVQVSINTTPFIIEELDRMIDENIFSSKNGAINGYPFWVLK